MLSSIFLVTIFYVGYSVHQKIFNNDFSSIRLPGYFLIGSSFSVTFIFISSILSGKLLTGLVIYFILFIVLLVLTLKKTIQELRTFRFRIKYLIYLILFLSFYLLFFHSFKYEKNILLIASNLYQDFGAHISFIRYFGSGNIIIPEVPFSAGSRLMYYFLFDFYAAILTFLGLRIDIALNLISALSLTFLFVTLYEISSSLVNSRVAGLLTCIFMLLNSDLSFLQIIKKYGYSLSQYYHHNIYLKGEFLGFIISGNFLNINVFLNQRQLLFGVLWFLYILLIILQYKKIRNFQVFFIGVFIALLPFWHLSVLISLYLVLLGISLFFKDKRIDIVKIVLVSLILVLPQILIIKLNSVNAVSFYPGFLAAHALSIKNFLALWIWNLGFSIPLALLGFFTSNKSVRKLSLSFFAVFIVANLFKFSPDIFDNHKFFNVWIISINILTAIGIVFLFKNYKFRILSLLLLILICISGLFHLLVVKNDVYAKIPDYTNSKIIMWAKQNTAPNSIFLTNGDIYDPANIAGLRTYIGRPRYIYLYGQNPDMRIKNRVLILNGPEKDKIRGVVSSADINYIIVYKSSFTSNLTEYNLKFLNSTFQKIYENSQGIIYKI